MGGKKKDRREKDKDKMRHSGTKGPGIKKVVYKSRKKGVLRGGNRKKRAEWKKNGKAKRGPELGRESGFPRVLISRVKDDQKRQKHR